MPCQRAALSLLDDYTVGDDNSTGDLIGILVINGNEACGTLDLRCELRGASGARADNMQHHAYHARLFALQC